MAPLLSLIYAHVTTKCTLKWCLAPAAAVTVTVRTCRFYVKVGHDMGTERIQDLLRLLQRLASGRLAALECPDVRYRKLIYCPRSSESWTLNTVLEPVLWHDFGGTDMNRVLTGRCQILSSMNVHMHAMAVQMLY